MAVGNRRTQEEIAQKGQELYEREIRAQVETRHRGRILAIDTDSGDYEIAAEVLDAVHALRQRRPHAVAYVVRVGYPAVYSLGARLGVTPA